MTRLTRWFLPSAPDLLGMLDAQAAVTLRGLHEFAAWSAGDGAAADRVRATEHEADEACRVLRAALRQAFSTPLEPEDLFALSERLDVVMNEAKNTVREADLLGVGPDRHTEVMGGALLDATEELVTGLALLGPRGVDRTLPDGANGTGRRRRASTAPDAADRAVKAERGVEHEYRRAMSALRADPDLRRVVATQEVYRRYTVIGEAVVRVADRIWYATVKNA